MMDQWRELRETITELRDNGGELTQHKVCKFLVSMMDVLEEQMPNLRNRALDGKDDPTHDLRGVLMKPIEYKWFMAGYDTATKEIVDYMLKIIDAHGEQLVHSIVDGTYSEIISADVLASVREDVLALKGGEL